MVCLHDVGVFRPAGVDEVLEEGTNLTPDIHGTATTAEYRDAIIDKMK